MQHNQDNHSSVCNKSSGSASSLSKLRDKDFDTLQYRVNFAKTLIQNTPLQNIVDYDNTETENFISSKEENKYLQRGYNEFHTRTKLGKKLFNLDKIIPKIGGTLHYIKSGSTGHTFRGFVYDEETGEKFYYALKVAAYDKKDSYGEYTDIRRPENAEICMVKLLSYFLIKKETPHIVLPIGTFNTSIRPFVSLIKDGTIRADDKKAKNYVKFVERYEQDRFHDYVSVLIGEWANRGDLGDFLRKNYETVTLLEWKVIFFQIISVLAVIQSKYPSFRHNDFKANNVLLHKNKPKINLLHHSYKIQDTQFYVPNINYTIKIWDFDFACIPGLVENNKVNAKWTEDINVNPVTNKYYDLHFFFNTLIRGGFLPQLLKSDDIPNEVKLFIKRIVPRKYRYYVTNDEAFYKKEVYPSDYNLLIKDKHLQKHPALAHYIGNVHHRGRLLVNDEYLIPINVLKEDPFFMEFREIPDYLKNKQYGINITNIANVANNPNDKKSLNINNNNHIISRSNFIKI